MILIDSSTGSRELLSKILETGAPACLVDIKDEGADYAFQGNGPDGPILIGIERKTLTDLVDSIYSGRLAGIQVPKMQETYSVRVLVVEGEWRADKEGRIVRPWAGGKTSFSRNGRRQHPEFQEIFGFGLSNSTFNGLSIDSNWLASYQEQGLFGVVVCVAILFFLFAAAYFQPGAVQRAVGLFLITYCLLASFTEVGFTDASTYLLDLTVAASVLVPSWSVGATPAIREG